MSLSDLTFDLGSDNDTILIFQGPNVPLGIFNDPHFGATVDAIDQNGNVARNNGYSFSTLTLGTAVLGAAPLPTTAPMFGLALLAFGAVGYGLKRKGKAVAAA